MHVSVLLQCVGGRVEAVTLAAAALTDPDTITVQLVSVWLAFAVIAIAIRVDCCELVQADILAVLPQQFHEAANAAFMSSGVMKPSLFTETMLSRSNERLWCELRARLFCVTD